jgi:hypothetical protein
MVRYEYAVPLRGSELENEKQSLSSSSLIDTERITEANCVLLIALCSCVALSCTTNYLLNDDKTNYSFHDKLYFRGTNAHRNTSVQFTPCDAATFNGYINQPLCCFGGVVVSVVATGPKGRGFKLGGGDGFLRATKIRSTPSFEWEAPCQRSHEYLRY